MSTSDLSQQPKKHNWALLVLFLVVVIGVGFAIGMTNLPGAWYQQINKPFYTPPNWLFAPAWTVLYIFIAIAGWRTFERGATKPAMKAWYAQMILNWMWTPIFFRFTEVWLAMIVLVAMVICAATFAWRTRKADRVSSLLFVPYLLWLLFAGALNLGIGVLN